MSQFGGKDSKRHFTVVMGGKEHGLYVSSTPSSAAKKAVTKLCAANKGKKVEFSIREITQGSKKKTYGPYLGHIEKLKEPIELKGRVIKYKPVAKLSGKTSAKKGGMRGGATLWINNQKQGYIICNKLQPPYLAEKNILFKILYDDFISSQDIFRLFNLTTAYMEKESNELVGHIPGESDENTTKRIENAAIKKKEGTTRYLKAMSYEGTQIQNSELTNIYIYIEKTKSYLIDTMKKIKVFGKSFIQLSDNVYNLQ